jgi:transposase
VGEDFALVQIDQLYRCLDKLLSHKQDLFSYLRQRWQALFDVNFDVLLYDLSSTYFESEPPEEGKRKFGYRRDKRPDCVQVVMAWIVTPEGFPLAYEVMGGNTSDKTPLGDFLKRIEKQYGKAHRTWGMDRGIPTDETLGQMRAAETPIYYLVGTPRGRLSKLEKEFLKLPWEQVRESVEVKLIEQAGELYILSRSAGRMHKECSMRQRRLKRLFKRLHELQQQKLTRDELLLKLGAAKKEAGHAYRLVDLHLPAKAQAVTPQTFTFALNRNKLRTVRRREGSYLLRSNLTRAPPARLWQYYIQLTEIEQAFKELKGDLSIRPIYHQKDARIEAHIFVAFMAYCLQVTLKYRLRALAPGLTPRAVLQKFAAMQMVDVHLPTTDGRYLILPRYTQPDKDQSLLLSQMKMELPQPPPPKITSNTALIA